MKINELEIDLNTQGWDNSGGKSQNVWGQVPSSNLPFNEINRAITSNTKQCIFTCYDNLLYQKDEHGNFKEANIKDVPKTISATFKPSYEKFSAVAENMGMKIAVLLGVPTSYNYIVSFDPDKHPKILSNISSSDRRRIKPYGIVSIDFLKPFTPTDDILICGEELFAFHDAIRFNEGISNQANIDLIDKWIKNFDEYAKVLMPDLKPEELNSQLDEAHRQIATSFLLREFLGDCDFSNFNSGFVMDRKAGTIKYAPNFDYGESFNSLIQTKLFTLPDENVVNQILEVDKDYLDRLLAQKDGILVEALAQEYSNSTSEANIKFIAKNYPQQYNEFLSRLVEATQNQEFDQIVESYTDVEDNKPTLLTKEEAEMFKVYLSTRAGWLQHKLIAINREINTETTIAKPNETQNIKEKDNSLS